MGTLGCPSDRRGQDVEAVVTCPGCDDTGIRALPVDRGWEDFPCPVCKTWLGGFPGERLRDHWIIKPSKEGELAEWVGLPNRATPSN